MIRGPRPLKDHVATLSGYLNQYKKQTDLNIQGDLSQEFTNYLLTTCWEKITRRVSSWQAMGFFQRIQQIHPNDIITEESLKDPNLSRVGPGDRSLVDFLGSLDGKMKKYLIYDHYRDYDKENLPSKEEEKDPLPSIFKTINLNSRPPQPIFSKGTVLEFHKLTLAAFHGFASSFLKIRAASKALVSIDYSG
jgi:hypothetical protein